MRYTHIHHLCLSLSRIESLFGDLVSKISFEHILHLSSPQLIPLLFFFLKNLRFTVFIPCLFANVICPVVVDCFPLHGLGLGQLLLSLTTPRLWRACAVVLYACAVVLYACASATALGLQCDMESSNLSASPCLRCSVA